MVGGRAPAGLSVGAHIGTNATEFEVRRGGIEFRAGTSTPACGPTIGTNATEC